jgi:hypothetical protein
VTHGQDVTNNPANRWVDIVDTTTNTLMGHILTTNQGIPGDIVISQGSSAPPPPPTEITVDIKPGPTDINCVQKTNNGSFPVAILGDDVDVHDIKISTLEIDDDSTPGGGVKPTRSSFSDVNGDGEIDLVL